MFRTIHRFRDKYAIEELCRIIGCSRSGYYKWLRRQDTSDRDERIVELIQQCHEKTHRTYGYRRVKMWLLREYGLVINHKAVLRITRKHNLLALPKKKRFRHYEMETYHHYENILNRDFNASRPNEKWVTDISYISTGQGFLYLSVIKDLFDKSIVAYRYSRQMPTQLVIDTIREAVKVAKPLRGVILHSDNGIHYSSIAYFNAVHTNEITPSMSRIGNPYDNACVESFFSLLKNECIHRAKPKSIDDAIELVEEYINFYNYERLQLSNGLTPMETRMLVA